MLAKFHLQQFNEFRVPRWASLTMEDALALVGYCYGRSTKHAGDGFDRRSEERRALVLAIFCCGGPWAAVRDAAGSYAETVLGASASESMARPAAYAIALTECTSAAISFDELTQLRAPLCDRVWDHAAAWRRAGLDEEMLDEHILAKLEMHGAALEGNRARLPTAPPEPLPGSLVVAAHQGDGEAFGKAVDETIRSVVDRANNSVRRGHTLFVHRVQGFQDYGAAFLHGGERCVGYALGLKVAPPAADTEPLHPPKCISIR